MPSFQELKLWHMCVWWSRWRFRHLSQPFWRWWKYRATLTLLLRGHQIYLPSTRSILIKKVKQMLMHQLYYKGLIKVLFDKLLHEAFISDANKSINFFSALKQRHLRYRHHLKHMVKAIMMESVIYFEFFCKFWDFINVHFDKVDGWIGFRYFVENRCKHFTRSTPSNPKRLSKVKMGLDTMP